MTEDFGPHTVEVKALIEQILRITPNQITKLAAAYDYASAAGRADAWADAWDAAWTSVLAVMVRDLISQVDFDTLYGPWKSVMEADDE